MTIIDPLSLMIQDLTSMQTLNNKRKKKKRRYQSIVLCAKFVTNLTSNLNLKYLIASHILSVFCRFVVEKFYEITQLFETILKVHTFSRKLQNSKKVQKLLQTYVYSVKRVSVQHE